MRRRGKGSEDYLNSVDMVESPAQPTIEHIDLGGISKVLEVLFLIETRKARSIFARCTILSHRLHCALLISEHHLEGNHLRPQPNDLADRIAARLIFHLPNHCFVRYKVRSVVLIGGMQVGEIDVLLQIDHVVAEMRHLDLIYEGAQVSEEQMRLRLILLLDDFVVKSRGS